MKVSLKIALVVLTAILLVTMISSNVFAASELITEIKKEGNGVMNGTSEITTMAGKILKLIRTAAIIVGTVIIAVLGIKYMMGSVEEKAEYKKSFMPLVIGIIVVMASTAIASLLFGLYE